MTPWSTFWKANFNAAFLLLGVALLIYDWKAVGLAAVGYLLFWDWWMNR